MKVVKAFIKPFCGSTNKCENEVYINFTYTKKSETLGAIKVMRLKIFYFEFLLHLKFFLSDFLKIM